MALDGKVFFFRQVTNTISVRQASGISARIELYDSNLKDTIISRNDRNEFIFTGLQILDQSAFNSTKEKIFSMNQIWDYLIKENSLIGIESKQKFYHLNTKEMYNKLISL